MGLNSITFVLGQNGLGRPLAGEDHITGLLGFTAGAPAGFSSVPAQKIFSYAEAVALGLTTADADKNISLLAYSIKMYFEFNPKGVLWVYVKSGSATLDFTKIVDLQQYAGGKIRQMGIVTATTTFATSQVNSIKAQRTILAGLNRPCEFVYGANTYGVTLSTIGDLAALTDDGVTVVNGQDGTGIGGTLSTTNTCSYPAVGAFLGVASAAKVHVNVGWVGKFNLAANQFNEFAEPAFGNNVKISDPAITAGLLSDLNDKRYVFLIPEDGVDGTYFNDSHCAVAKTSDYAYFENNRTINKAIRNSRSKLLPLLNSPLYVNADGTLTEDTIAEFKNACSQALEQMFNDGEVSNFEVLINPAQNVLSSSQLIVTIKIVPVGVARNIVVNIGYTLSVGNGQ